MYQTLIVSWTIVYSLFFGIGLALYIYNKKREGDEK